jgi:peptidoglycan DL-endopeptidase CwlO
VRTLRPAQQVGGVNLDAEQLANAQTITATTQAAGMPSRAAVVAVATALQESSLRNLG